MLPNLAPCAPMSNRNTETENWKTRNREAFSFLCQAKGRHSRLTPQELRPPPWGIRDFIWGGSQSGVCDKDQSSEGLAFLFFCKFMAKAGIRRLSNRVWCP